MTTAGAAQVTLLVRERILGAGGRVKHVRGLGHGSEEKGSGGTTPGQPHARGKETCQLLAGEGEGVIGAIGQGGRAQEVIGAQDGGRGDGRGAVQQPGGSGGGSTGEPRKAKAMLQAGSVGGREVPGPSGQGTSLLGVVDEVASGPVGAEADGVEGATELRLVLGVTGEAPQLVDAMCELTLVPVLTGPVLFEGATQLRLVAARVDLAAARLLLGGQQPLTPLGEGAISEAAVPGAQARGWLALEAAEKLVLMELGAGQGHRMPPGKASTGWGAHRLPVQQAAPRTRGTVVQHLVTLQRKERGLVSDKGYPVGPRRKGDPLSPV